MLYPGHSYGGAYGSVYTTFASTSELVVYSSEHEIDSSSPELGDDNFVTVFDANHNTFSNTLEIVSQQEIDPNSSVHSLSSTGGTLKQNTTLSPSVSVHMLVSDEIEVTTFTLLNKPKNTSHSLTNVIPDISEDGEISVHSASHKVTSELQRIIDWAVYNVYFGNYVEHNIETGKFK